MKERKEYSLLMAFCLCTTGIFPKNIVQYFLNQVCSVDNIKHEASYEIFLKHFYYKTQTNKKLKRETSKNIISKHFNQRGKMIIVRCALKAARVQEYRANYTSRIKYLMSNITLQIFHSSCPFFLPTTIFYFCHVFNNVKCFLLPLSRPIFLLGFIEVLTCDLLFDKSFEVD